MPYLTPSGRHPYHTPLEVLRGLLAEVGPEAVPGHLNFIVTALLSGVVSDQGASYRLYNALVGALECCKLEFYRRAVARYEDTKIAANGDVLPPGERKGPEA